MIEPFSLFTVINWIVLGGGWWRRRGRQLVNWRVHRWWSLLHRWEVVWWNAVGWLMMSGFGWMIGLIRSALFI